MAGAALVALVCLVCWVCVAWGQGLPPAPPVPEAVGVSVGPGMIVSLRDLTVPGALAAIAWMFRTGVPIRVGVYHYHRVVGSREGWGDEPTNPGLAPSHE